MRRLARIASVTALVAGAAALAETPFSRAQVPDTCKDEPSIVERLACFTGTAKAADDPAACLEAEERPVVFNCISKVAENTGRAETCALIPDEFGLDAGLLRESCVAAVAIEQGKPSFCETMATMAIRDSCYLLTVTRGGADAEMCGRIRAEPMRRACLEE